MDYVDVVGDAFTAPGLNAFVGGGMDWRPFAEKRENRGFKMVLVNKGLGQFGIDAGVNFAAGIAGDALWGVTSSALKSSGVQLITEKSIFYISTQPGFNVLNQGLNKKISEINNGQ